MGLGWDGMGATVVTSCLLPLNLSKTGQHLKERICSKKDTFFTLRVDSQREEANVKMAGFTPVTQRQPTRLRTTNATEIN